MSESQGVLPKERQDFDSSTRRTGLQLTDDIGPSRHRSNAVAVWILITEDDQPRIILFGQMWAVAQPKISTFSERSSPTEDACQAQLVPGGEALAIHCGVVLCYSRYNVSIKESMASAIFLPGCRHRHPKLQALFFSEVSYLIAWAAA